MTRKVVIWSVVAVAAGLAVGAAVAGGRGLHGGACPLGRAGAGMGWFGHGPGMHLRHLVDDLDLTADQKESIKGILREARGRIQPNVEAAHDARRAMLEAALTRGGDEKAAREASEAVGRAVSDLAFEAARTLTAVRGTLTPEQVETLDRKIAAHRERHEERAGRFREFREERFEEFLESF
jgi:Spy/CpxP family protein refolding chaperone